MMFSRWKTTISKTVPTTAQTAAAIQTGRVCKVAKLTEYRKPYQITKKTGQAGFLNVAFFGSRGLARISKPNAVVSPTTTNPRYPKRVRLFPSRTSWTEFGKSEGADSH